MAVIVKLLSKFDDSGIKKAQHGFGGLKKTLAGIGLGLGLKQVADTLVEAAKAASADQKSMLLLNTQLKKNANATNAQITANNKFIDTLSTQVGIVDDDLRPAQARLARATGSTAKSQQLLKLALDASKVSGKSLDTVATALAKAYNGNTSSLIRMFPELKKSKNALADLTKEVEGAAAQQADPFAKFNVAMDNLKEKLGMVILPYLSQFIDEMMKPGGAIDQVGKFLEDVSNPKTEAGQMFLQVKDAVSQTIGGVKDFFALFGNGDAMKGFGVVVSNLVKALPALLALKGIMMLASATKTIKNLALAIGLMQAKGGGGGAGGTPIVTGAITAVAAAMGISTAALLSLGASVVTILTMSGDTMQKPPRDVSNLDPKTGMRKGFVSPNLSGLPSTNNSGVFNSKTWKQQPSNNITINVQGADPKATVDALGKYVKTNGSLPPSLFTGIKP
jgi:hypothetical protein